MGPDFFCKLDWALRYRQEAELIIVIGVGLPLITFPGIIYSRKCGPSLLTIKRKQMLFKHCTLITESQAYIVYTVAISYILHLAPDIS